jgi:hypothetical protein
MVAANEDVIHMRRKNKVVGTTPAASHVNKEMEERR